MKHLKEKKKRPEETADDGRTVAPMTGDWMPWNGGIGRRSGKRTNDNGDGTADNRHEPVEMTPEEKRAMIKGAMMVYLPALGVLIGVGILMFILARFWLM